MTNFYLNPVYNRGFPDPFVLKYCGEYWAYCTGVWHDGRCFGVLHSRDLVHWRALAGAMAPLPGGFPCYWAPEVTYHNGRFFMYYSVGDEEHMAIRVAVARHPAGPFVDSGRQLTSEPFAIDAHVFVDEDGARYLFYATDFLDHSHIGTGTVRDRLLDPFTLEGQPRPVTLPRYDWHVYDPHRIEKGGVRWHTVEGPFVLKHKGRYYQMFSGGNWKNVTYGVSYAMADDIASTEEWTQVADGERVLPILHTLPGRVIGPGHNSVVRGPDNMQLYCIYHRWAEDLSDRVLAIDPLDWAGERMLVPGPSTTPRPVPTLPTFADFFDAEREGGLGEGWECRGGHWSAQGGAAVQPAPDGAAEARLALPLSHAVIEVSLRGLAAERHGAFGIELRPHAQPHEALRFLIVPACGNIEVSYAGDQGRSDGESFRLPDDFDSSVFHLLRLELDGRAVRLCLDDLHMQWQGRLDAGPVDVALITRSATAAFAGFALTVGWQHLFTGPGVAVEDLGWEPVGAAARWRLEGGQLWCSPAELPAAITKGPLLEAYELVVNARLAGADDLNGCYGFYPVARPGQPGPLIMLKPSAGGWALAYLDVHRQHSFPLPHDFDPLAFQQFRFRKQSGRLTLQWEMHDLGEIPTPSGPTQVGLYAHNATVAFDMVRVTALGSRKH